MNEPLQRRIDSIECDFMTLAHNNPVAASFYQQVKLEREMHREAFKQLTGALQEYVGDIVLLREALRVNGEEQALSLASTQIDDQEFQADHQ